MDNLRPQQQFGLNLAWTSPGHLVNFIQIAYPFHSHYNFSALSSILVSSSSFTCGAQGNPTTTTTPFLNLEILIFLNPSRKKQFSSLSSSSPEYKGRMGDGPASPQWGLCLSRTLTSLLWMASREAAAEGSAWKKPGYPGYTIWKHAMLSSSHLCLLLCST